MFFALTGIISLVIALRFATRGRPSMVDDVQPNGDALIEADQVEFLAKYLVPSLFSAICFAQLFGTDYFGELFQREPPVYHPITGWLIPKYSRFYVAVMGGAIGAVIYAVGWVSGWPARRDIRDFACWIIAGATYGVLVFGIWFYFYLQIPETIPGEEESLIISSLNSTVFYIIFGVAWILFAQWFADVIFVGLSSYRKEFNEDQEWLGRAGGWLIGTIVAWVLLTFPHDRGVPDAG